MKKGYITAIVLSSLSFIFLIVFSVLQGLGIESYWKNLSLGMFLVLLFGALAVFLLSKFSSQKMPEIKSGVICPRCQNIYDKDIEKCPTCGEKNPEYRKNK